MIKKEGLFKRLKNIEKVEKVLIGGDDNESIYTHLDQNLMIKMINIKKKQQANNVDTKPSNVFDYLKRLTQKTKDLMDAIEEVNNDIDIYKLVFFGSNKEKFNFNTFRIPLNFLSDIYNGEFSLKEAEFLKEK